MPLPLAIPTLLSGLSWVMGGKPAVTDLAFICLTIICAWYLGLELIHFPRRFGVGGIVLYGGVLIWFCFDYLTHWAGADFRDPGIPFTPETISKAAFYHCLAVSMMSIGLLIPGGRWLEKLFFVIPEPNSPRIYFVLIVFIAIVGFSPYFLCTYESPNQALWRLLTFRAADAPWTMGRSGNLNYNWGGYVAELLEVGATGALLGVAYAILVSTSLFEKIVCWVIWLHYFFYAFYGGRRGGTIFFILPPMALFFIKRQAIAVNRAKRFSLGAYALVIIVLAITVVIIQIQITYRDRGFSDVNLSDVNVFDIQGNSMFSEGLSGYEMIPDHQGFFSNRFPGEGIIRPIPELAFWILVHPIPRALWNNKPIDPLWEWYNTLSAGTGREGTTVSKGLVGWWYFRFGIFGVIEGCIVMGWFMGTAERALQNAGGRLTVILLSMGITVWLLRCYRDIGMLELYSVIVGAGALWIVLRVAKLVNPELFSAPGATSE